MKPTFGHKFARSMFMPIFAAAVGYVNILVVQTKLSLISGSLLLIGAFFVTLGRDQLLRADRRLAQLKQLTDGYANPKT